VLVYYFSAQTFYQPEPGLPPLPSLGEHFLIIPIGMVVQAVIPVPGGLGVGEASFGALYGLIHPELAPFGVLMALVNRMISWGVSLVGYIIYLQMRPSLPVVPGAEATVANGQPDLAPVEAEACQKIA